MHAEKGKVVWSILKIMFALAAGAVNNWINFIIIFKVMYYGKILLWKEYR